MIRPRAAPQRRRYACDFPLTVPFNVAMQLERSEFLGAEAYERTKSLRGYRNGFKGKRIRTRVGELRLEIPPVRGLRYLSQVAGESLPFGEGPILLQGSISVQFGLSVF